VKDGVMGLLTEKGTFQKIQLTPISELQQRQKTWRQMYSNNASWLVPNRIWSTNLSATASSEVARLVTLDMRAAVTSDAVLENIFSKEVLWDIRNKVEYGLAFGALILKPYLTGSKVRFTFAQPNMYEILQHDTDGTILEIYFKDYEAIRSEGYVQYIIRVEHHVFDRNLDTYYITNEVYRSDKNGNIGVKYTNTQEALDLVLRWKGIAIEQILKGVTQPLFGFFRTATSNTIDTTSPHGVSIFDKAKDTIQLADLQLSGLVREFKIKEGRLYVDRLTLDNTNRRRAVVPYLADDFYVRMDVEGRQGETFFEVFSPEIRSKAFLDTLNRYQQLVEDNIGLMHGTFSQPDKVDRTATEVRESKHRTYSTVSSNQTALRKSFEDALYAVAYYINKATKDIILVTEFDDSLLKDPQETLLSMKEDVGAGLIRPEIYLAKKYKVSEDDALKMMPKGPQLVRGTNTILTWSEVKSEHEEGTGE